MTDLSESEVKDKILKFKMELHALCAKHAVTIQADDHWMGYAECGQDVRMTVGFDDWQIDDIDLGMWVDGQGNGGV